MAGEAVSNSDSSRMKMDMEFSDGSGEKMRTGLPCEVFIQNTQNMGFGRANNQLLEHVRSEYVLLLNTDAFMAPGTMGKSLAYMDAHPRCGILGVRLTHADGFDQVVHGGPGGAASLFNPRWGGSVPTGR